MLDTKPHILVVDDEPLNLEIICEYLEENDYQLSTADNGAIAWGMLEKDPKNYDVILLDRMMPEMDGMEVLAKINAHSILKFCPVIMQTAKASKNDIQEGMQSGAYYYLTKPFEGSMLLSIVEAAVKEREQFMGLQHKLENNHEALGLVRSACFEFQTLKQTHSLATLIASTFPEPESAVMGISELLINAVEHGNLGITYQDKTRLNENGSWSEEVERLLQEKQNINKFATLGFHKNNQEIKLIIKDQGQGFDWQSYMEMSADRATDNHGRGIAMANLLSFSRIEYQGVGNEVHAYMDIARKDEG